MPQEDQYKQQNEKVNPLVLDMLDRAFADQKAQAKEEKEQQKKDKQEQKKRD